MSANKRASWREVLDVLRSCGALTPGVLALVGGYYLLTPVGAVADGASWLLLVRVFAAQAPASAAGPLDSLLAWLKVPVAGDGLLGAVVVLFFFKAALVVVLAQLEARMTAIIRRRVQEACFDRILTGRWEDLRSGQVGRWTGALTEEAGLFTKLVVSGFNAAYSCVSFVLLALMALAAAPKLSFLLAAVGVPAWLFLKTFYRLQTSLSSDQARARQGFAADLNEILSGLFQVKASGDAAPARARGLRRQDDLQDRELKLGWTLGVLTAMNPFLLALMLGVYLLRARWLGAPWAADVAAFGSVGVLSFRAATQLNILVAALGNLTRLAGSVEPVHRLVAITGETPRAPLPGRLDRVSLDRVAYAYDGRTVLKDVSLEIKPGRVLLITGPSGTGKTTLVNLVAGLCTPAAGRVNYGSAGRDYEAARWRARLGYVAQDVHLISGPLRENLDPLGVLGDEALWRALDAAEASGFARARGGLDATIEEAGRSLSGGEKRRLSIARALAAEPDGLILDEITNGLDEASKTSLLKTVESLARGRIVVAISHDLAAFSGVEHDSFRITHA